MSGFLSKGVTKVDLKLDGKQSSARQVGQMCNRVGEYIGTGDKE